jgi:hypothetical protein
MDAALLLNNKCLYSAVPHTAYFSCFLLMEHIYYVVNKKTYNSLYESDGKYESSHLHMANAIIALANENCDSVAVRDIPSYIRTLKILRKKADYEDEDILNGDSSKAIETAEKLVKILNKLL